MNDEQLKIFAELQMEAWQDMYSKTMMEKRFTKQHQHIAAEMSLRFQELYDNLEDPTNPIVRAFKSQM